MPCRREGQKRPFVPCGFCGALFERKYFSHEFCSRRCRYAGARAARRTELEPPPVDGARWIQLAGGHFALVDEADFEWVNAHAWSLVGGYARGVIDGRHMSMHVLIFGSPFVDHGNGDRLDNRRDNLRAATLAQNAYNRARPSTNTSGYKGAHFRKRAAYQQRPWEAHIKVDGRMRYLGNFPSAEEAARAYDAAARQHFGAFARLNFPDEAPP